MNKVFVSLTLAACALAMAAPLAGQAPAAAEKPKVAGVVALGEVKVTATVEAIDVAKRMLTLKGPAGNVETFEVDAAVKNLPQVKKGDQVVVAYKESLAYEVRKPSPGGGVTVSGAAAAAKAGEKPGMAGGRQVTATVTITAIDPKVPSVTMKGPGGNERTIKVKDPKKLEGVKVGDSVEIIYTEALAISVEPASKK